MSPRTTAKAKPKDKGKAPRGTEMFAGFLAGAAAMAALAYFFWKSQIPPPPDG